MNGRDPVVVVGGGMAAARLLQQLAAIGYPGAITLISEEVVAGYNRVLLPGLLAGRCRRDSLITLTPDWLRTHGITVLEGRRAIALDLAARRVTLDDGGWVSYGRLVLATGAEAPLPDVSGIGLEGVAVLRSLADAERLGRLARDGRSAVVIGGGLLGLETAHALLELGLEVQVVHRHSRLLNRQLDDAAAALLAQALEARGLRLLLDATPTAIPGAGRVTGVTVSLARGNRRTLPADLVVFATGTRARDALAAAAGIRCDGGVLVGDQLATSEPGVHALGECARVGGVCHALVEPVHRQADVLARVLCGERARFVAPRVATRLKIPGIEVFAAGEPDAVGSDDLVIRDRARGLYRRLWFREGALVGAVLLGDAAGGREIQQAMAAPEASDRQVDTRTRVELAFGLAPAA